MNERNFLFCNRSLNRIERFPLQYFILCIKVALRMFNTFNAFQAVVHNPYRNPGMNCLIDTHKYDFESSPKLGNKYCEINSF